MDMSREDGGPAFPKPDVTWSKGEDLCGTPGQDGMSLLDYFAAHYNPPWELVEIYAREIFKVSKDKSVDAYECSFATAALRYSHARMMIQTYKDSGN